MSSSLPLNPVVLLYGIRIRISLFSRNFTLPHRSVEEESNFFSWGDSISPILQDVKKLVVQAAHITCLEKSDQFNLLNLWPRIFSRSILIGNLSFLHVAVRSE